MASMEKDPQLSEQLERMRRDWDARAAEDAEYYVRTPDESGASFEESGRRNYQEQIQPLLDLLLDGRPPLECRVVEIGCGLGRITRWIAAHFREVDGVDISPEMLARARERLRDCPNVTLHQGSGTDLAGLPDSSFDLAFSYIVFQHIPSRQVIAAYIRDTARVLRAGGAFRFQVNGWRAPEYRRAPKDSWLGESFSLAEVLAMLRDAGLQPLTCQDAGRQDMWITARKPRDLSQASPELLRRELAERQAWEANLARELAAEPSSADRLAAELESRTAWAKSLEEELQRARGHLASLQAAFDDRSEWGKELSASLEKAKQDFAALQQELDERTAWAQSLEEELCRTRGHFEALQKEFSERTEWALSMRDELSRLKQGKSESQKSKGKS
jgi:SAM-dependent methyltransferase